jgi:hypothetical protein
MGQTLRLDYAQGHFDRQNTSLKYKNVRLLQPKGSAKKHMGF